MKYFALALLFLVYVSSALAGGVVVEYKGNVTLVDADSFKFRSTAIWAWDLVVTEGASFVAVEADATKTAADLDLLFGAAWVGSGIAPSAYIAFFSAQSQFQNTSAGGQNVSVSAAAALLASAWVSIDEVDSNGNVVQTVYLKDLLWSVDSSSLGVNGLRYITFVGTQLLPLGSQLKVYLTYVLSNVVGVLNVVGDPIVTPRAVETILDIENFPYNSDNDKLRLNFAVGAEAGAASVDGTSYVSGSGDTATYFALKEVALVNGQTANVQVGEWIVAEGGSLALQSTDLASQVTAKWGGAAVFKIVSVTTTTPGASSIIYDPALGNGPQPQTASASTFVCSALLLLLLIVNLL
jgi:hypothetical protein